MVLTSSAGLRMYEKNDFLSRSLSGTFPVGLLSMRFEEPYVGEGDFGGRLIAAVGRGGTEPRDMLG